MKWRHILGGGVLATGLTLGAIAGAGTAGANTLTGIGFPGINTTTTLTVSTPTATSPQTVTMTATVSLEGINGLLISPSGPVEFEGTEYPLGGGENYYPTQTANLSNCLLGLPSVLGLWQTTCSATVTFPLTYGRCGPTELLAEYQGTTDLIADPSGSNRVILPATCGR